MTIDRTLDFPVTWSGGNADARERRDPPRQQANRLRISGDGEDRRHPLCMRSAYSRAFAKLCVVNAAPLHRVQNRIAPMQLPLSPERRRPRLDRREAAQMLQCSRDNIRRLDKIGQLKTGKQDRYGTFTYDRREIEELARKRGLQIKASGELAARVFAMFKSRARFEDIVIETQQEPDAILALWNRDRAGFDELAESRATREEHEHRAHEDAMREMDAEFARRRRAE